MSFKTKAKGERFVILWNPAAQTRPVLHSFSFVPVPTLPRKLATILLLAFSLFELVAACLSVYVQKATRRMEKSANTHNRLGYFLINKIFLLHVVYRYILVIFIVKCVTITLFLSLLIQRFDGKAWFLSFSHPLKLYMILYSTGTVLFDCSIVSWGLGWNVESTTFIRIRERERERERESTLQMYNVVYSTLHYYII